MPFFLILVVVRQNISGVILSTRISVYTKLKILIKFIFSDPKGTRDNEEV